MWECRGGFLYLLLYDTVHSSQIKHLLQKSRLTVVWISTPASLSKLQSGWAWQESPLDENREPHNCVRALGYLRPEHSFFTVLWGFNLIFCCWLYCSVKVQGFL